jgi:hypothetical protein
MAWQTPKTNWQENNALTPTDFNRIEGNIQHLQDTKETPAGAQAKANTAEANAKAYTDAHEQKAAPHSGHETPAGAQAKVDTHAGSKQTHGISGGYYIAKTSRSDQLPAWNDIQGKPSLVTPSDLSSALAAKVDKPSSATSGNIAVFDGGPGKLKDGGKSVNSLLHGLGSFISVGTPLSATAPVVIQSIALNFTPRRVIIWAPHPDGTTQSAGITIYDVVSDKYYRFWAGTSSAFFSEVSLIQVGAKQGTDTRTASMYVVVSTNKLEFAVRGQSDGHVTNITEPILWEAIP